MKINELTKAAVLNRDMQIPVAVLGQNMRLSVGQLLDKGVIRPIFDPETGRLNFTDLDGDKLLDSDIEIKDGVDALTVEIVSDLGNIIRNGEGSRTLTAHVTLGANNITDTLPAGSFSWLRTSHDTSDDAVWNSLHDGTGAVCVVDADDVNRSALFECRVTLPQQPPSD